MMNFWRALFGFGDSSGKRTVLGDVVGIDVKDVKYIRESNERLNTLHTLYSRYKGTPQEQKFKTVFDKTKHIHNYLVSRGRVHELELFHVQHTDHFISTFTVIMDVHQRITAETIAILEEEKIVAEKAQKKEKQKPESTHADFESKVENVLQRIESETIKGIYTAHKISEMVKRVANQAPIVQEEALRSEAPGLSVPTIAIDTYSRVFYAGEGGRSREVSFTSTEQEKEAFLLHLAAHLGISKSSISYVGNAMVTLPLNNGSTLSEYAPVVHWNGATYALDVANYRLFPVKIFRRSF